MPPTLRPTARSTRRHACLEFFDLPPSAANPRRRTDWSRPGAGHLRNPPRGEGRQARLYLRPRRSAPPGSGHVRIGPRQDRLNANRNVIFLKSFFVLFRFCCFPGRSLLNLVVVFQHIFCILFQTSTTNRSLSVRRRFIETCSMDCSSVCVP